MNIKELLGRFIRKAGDVDFILSVQEERGTIDWEIRIEKLGRKYLYFYYKSSSSPRGLQREPLSNIDQVIVYMEKGKVSTVELLEDKTINQGRISNV